jgi:hypothetical protein
MHHPLITVAVSSFGLWALSVALLLWAFGIQAL